MSNQTFKRYELKYMLTQRQREMLVNAMGQYMKLDKYGHSTIRNIYFDTENYRLIRRSIEKPAYKEKLRIRSYKQVSPDENVFVELKKKYDSVVYKRRLSCPLESAMDCLSNCSPLPVKSQIASEINYFCSYYQTLRPAVFLSYEREAFFPVDESDFRITFDENIYYRRQELSLDTDVWGIPLTNRDQVLMEIKTSGGMPLLITHFLTEQKLYKTSFSKYGTAYESILRTGNLGGQYYA